MAKFERLQAECPPDAHKVIRPPLKTLNASLCIKFADSSEFEKYSDRDVAEVISLMSSKPLILCSKEIEDRIKAVAKEAEIEPGFIRLYDDNKASIEYLDGMISSCVDFYDMSDNVDDYDKYLERLSQKCIIAVNTLSMLILRSISTVYPWDDLLASDFVRQYKNAYSKLTDDDKSLFTDIRYGRIDPFTVKETRVDVYSYLRLERKLFLQYPTEDD